MAGQSGYTSREISSMQDDAVRRVNEMQRLARERVLVQPQQGDFMHPPINQAEPNRTIHNSNRNENDHGAFNQTQHVPPSQVEIVHQGFAGILEKLNLDDEKLLLILLIILLINEGADTILILALGFVLLC